jgi:hypothetical protein
VFSVFLHVARPEKYRPISALNAFPLFSAMAINASLSSWSSASRRIASSVVMPGLPLSFELEPQ